MKFRASYSILSTWASGGWENAIKAYFKLDTFITPAMVMGSQYHKEWEQHINTTKTLPSVFGGGKLANPIAEHKTVVELEPWLDLVGIIDCIDSPTIYEFKTGKGTSESYANGYQASVYGVLASFAGLTADRAVIWHYDQYSKKSDMSMVWLTDKVINKAHEWIITQASDMHAYLLENSLYERFGHDK